MKSGPPISEVITPTGRPDTITDFAIMSQIIRNSPPNTADAGMRYLQSDPITNLTIWGITSPTNPIVPVNETISAVHTETIIRIMVRSLFGSIPRDFTAPSSIPRMFNFFANTVSIVIQTKDDETQKGMLFHLRLPRFPRFQL